MEKYPINWNKNFISYKDKYYIIADVAMAREKNPLSQNHEPRRWEIGTMIEKHEEKTMTIGNAVKRVYDNLEEGIQSAFQYGRDVIDGKIPGPDWI